MRESLIGEKQIVSKSSMNLALRNGQRGRNPQTTGEKEGFAREMAGCLAILGIAKNGLPRLWARNWGLARVIAQNL
jgi:hypothetical protein